MNLCQGCFSDLPWNRNCCHQCALPLKTGNLGASHCGQCIRKPPPFDRTISPFIYSEPVNRLIAGFKFNNKLVNGELLSHLLGDSIQREAPQLPELIIPVPLHRARLRERGYNQALELARPLKRRLGIPVAQNTVVRNRATPPQTSLEKKARQKNIRGSFVVPKRLPYRHVAIVDDVITTGATVAELARILKHTGIERVDIWSMARTP